MLILGQRAAFRNRYLLALFLGIPRVVRLDALGMPDIFAILRMLREAIDLHHDGVLHLGGHDGTRERSSFILLDVSCHFKITNYKHQITKQYLNSDF